MKPAIRLIGVEQLSGGFAVLAEAALLSRCQTVVKETVDVHGASGRPQFEWDDGESRAVILLETVAELRFDREV